jgi:hypothetical protein
MLCKFPVGQTQSQLPNADLVIKVADSEIQVRPLVGSDEHCCAKINAMHMHDRKNRTYVPINIYRPFLVLTSVQPHGPDNGVVAPCQLGAVGHSDWLPPAGSSSGTQRAVPIWCTYSLSSLGCIELLFLSTLVFTSKTRTAGAASMAVEVCHGAAAPYSSQSPEEMRSRPVMAVASNQPAAPCHT